MSVDEENDRPISLLVSPYRLRSMAICSLSTISPPWLRHSSGVNRSMLRWPNLTPCQSSNYENYESMDFKFREGDHVTEDTDPAKFGMDHVRVDGSRIQMVAKCTDSVILFLFCLLSL